MPKPRNVSLPEDLFAHLSLHLFSPLDGRVPHGAYTRFFVPLIRAHFAQSHLDLAEWTGAEAGEQVVHGEAGVIETLHQLLKGHKA